MNNQERDAFIVGKLNEGVSLSDVQKLLKAQGVSMTYFDLRMLAAELEVNWKKQEPEPPPAPPAPAAAKKPAAPAGGAPATYDLDSPEAATGGEGARTVVNISRLVRPGSVMSGDVTFASGAKGDWSLDQRGRLALNLAPESAKPTQEDMLDFQEELQRKLSNGQM